MEKQVKQFEVGKTYGMNSACDSECWWYYRVEKRTKSTLTLRQIHSNGEPYKETITCRINKRDTEYLKAEACRPLGTYSMSPILAADRIIEQPKTKVHKQGTTPDGKEVKVVERYNKMAVSEGIFLIYDGEETEYSFLGTAITQFNDLVRPIKKDEPKAIVKKLSEHGTLIIGGCGFGKK